MQRTLYPRVHILQVEHVVRIPCDFRRKSHDGESRTKHPPRLPPYRTVPGKVHVAATCTFRDLFSLRWPVGYTLHSAGLGSFASPFLSSIGQTNGRFSGTTYSHMNTNHRVDSHGISRLIGNAAISTAEEVDRQSKD